MAYASLILKVTNWQLGYVTLKVKVNNWQLGVQKLNQLRLFQKSNRFFFYFKYLQLIALGACTVLLGLVLLKRKLKLYVSNKRLAHFQGMSADRCWTTSCAALCTGKSRTHTCATKSDFFRHVFSRLKIEEFGKKFTF